MPAFPESGGAAATSWRWRFVRVSNPSETYTVDINPNDMTSPYGEANLLVRTTTAVDGQPLVAEGATQPANWQFSGVILYEAHFKALLIWREKRTRIYIYDHLNRRMTCYLTKFDPRPKRSLKFKWKHDFTMSAVVLAVVDVAP